MISNTGNFSLILYCILVFLALSGVGYIYHLIRSGKFENEKIDRITDLFKIAMITVAIETATLIIADLFKEREQDVSEMTAYVDFLPYITDTIKSLDDKIDFCDFMVTVAPDGPLKKRWLQWQQRLLEKAAQFNKIDRQITIEQRVLDTQTTKPSVQQVAHIEQLELQKINLLENIGANTGATYLVVVSADKVFDEAKYEVDRIKKNYHYATIYKKGNWYRTVVPVESGFADARAIAASIAKSLGGNRQPYVVSMNSWCRSTSFSTKENCIICN